MTGKDFTFSATVLPYICNKSGSKSVVKFFNMTGFSCRYCACRQPSLLEALPVSSTPSHSAIQLHCLHYEQGAKKRHVYDV